MARKGKKKTDGSGDQKQQPTPEGAQGAQQGPSGQPQQPPVQEVSQVPAEVSQPSGAQPKKKKGKQQQQQQQREKSVEPQPETQVTQPADVPAPQALAQGQGKRKGKQKQQQEQQREAVPQGAPPQQHVDRGQPVQGFAPLPQGPPPQQPAWGAPRGQASPSHAPLPQAPQLQQPAWGQARPSYAPLPQGAPPQQSAWGAPRGQATPGYAPLPQGPPPQQPAWGAPRGQAPPMQQPPQQAFPRGQTPPMQQPFQQAPPMQQPPQQAFPMGQIPPIQQPPQQAFPRGRTPPMQQPFQQAPSMQQPPQQAYVMGQPPPMQQPPQEQPAGRGQPSQRGRGRGRGGRGAGAQPPGFGRGAGPAPEQQHSVPPHQQITQVPVTQMQKMHMGAGDQAQPRQPAKQGGQPAGPSGAGGDEFALAKRRDMRQGGTKGRRLTVQTNHLELRFKPKSDTAFHYDVTIDPDKPKRMMRYAWEEFRSVYLPRIEIAFDDVKNAYSPTRFPDLSGEVTVDEDGRSKKYTVVVKAAAEVNLRALFTYMESGGRLPVPQDALQCIDIVLRNASALTFVRVGRSFFSEPREGRIVKLGDGLELWHGFFQSAIIGWKPFLNVDVAHKGFPTDQPVIDLLEELSIQGRNRLQMQAVIPKANRFLKGLKVEYAMPRQVATRKTYRVNELVEIPERAMFVHDNLEISVFQYFQKVKGYTIQNRDYPCLWVGSRDKRVYLPPELCKIVKGQVCNRKLNEIQTSNMVRNAATNTTIRKEKIMNMVQKINLNNDPVVRAFGIGVGSEFEQIPARLLDPPELEYGRQQRVQPFKGTWRASEFLLPQEMPDGKWAIINLDRWTKDDDLSHFVRTIQQEAGKLGMRVGRPMQPFERVERFEPRRFKEVLMKYKQCSIVFVIVTDFPEHVYSRVKQLAELEVGLLTQCIRSRTMQRMTAATVTNIMLKVNAKLNGKNHIIANTCRPKCFMRPCMVMGADVTHPSPDQRDIPSVAAVTASYDATAFRYNFCWRLQSARQEIIEDLENIVQEQLLIFYRVTKYYPERIIFFRDGVSEGQFKEVMNMEVQAIKRACRKMGTPDTYKPQITFVVVQKRHHTRFFPTNPRESDDRNMNVRAGTVVDTNITHPTALEYYLVSHASIQGVARPTKYRVLYDEATMTEDELEELTYYLCHMFSRCTRSVSYPAPTYYAHLAAFRARHYLEGYRINLDNLAHEQSMRNIQQKVKDMPMFFV